MRIDDDEITIDLEPQFPELFKKYREALVLLEQLFAPLDDEFYVDNLQHVVFRHCARSVQMVRGVLFLCRLGHGLDSVALLRTLTEHIINAYYITYQKRRKALWPYLKYGPVERWRNFNSMLEFQQSWSRHPTVRDMATRDQISGWRRKYHQNKKSFMNRSGDIRTSWCQLTVRQRAQFVDKDKRVHSNGQLEELYMVVTRLWGNPVIHGTASALIQIPRGKGEVFLDASPSEHWIDPCLRVGLTSIFLIAQLANIVGKMKRKDLVRRIEKVCGPENA